MNKPIMLENKRNLAIITIVFLVGALILASMNFATATIYDENHVKYPGLSPKIDQKIIQIIHGNNQQVIAHKLGTTYQNKKVAVYINLIPNQTVNIPAGLEIVAKDENILVAKLTADQINQTSQLSFVRSITLPNILRPDVISEGVKFSSADILHNVGITGKGITIAIIDEGFFTNDPKITSNIVSAKLFDSGGNCAGSISCGDQAGNSHGTAVAEIVKDMAPEAKFILYTIQSPVDFDNAVDDAILNHVQIITASLDAPTLGGDGTTHLFRDGTSIMAKKINQAKSSGIFVTIAAGNSGQSHWKGIYSPSTVTPASIGLAGYQSVMNFQPFATGNLKACLPVIDHGDNFIATWNEWPTTNQDYDFFLYDSSMANLITGSNDPQTGIQPPIEEFSGGNIGLACLVVASLSSTQNHLFHIDAGHNSVNPSFAIRSGSIGTPADASGAFAVGAIDQTTDSLEVFSSSGPTDDNRLKPEMCGPDDVSTGQASLSPFFGTSASTPHVAGAAALLLQQNPSLIPDQLKQKLLNLARFNPVYSVNNLCGSNSGALSLKFPDSTRTTIVPILLQKVIGIPQVIQAKVTDTASSGGTLPNGTSSFIATGLAGKFNSTTCNLVKFNNTTSFCSVTFTGSASGTANITTTFTPSAADHSIHTASHSSALLAIDKRNTATQETPTIGSTTNGVTTTFFGKVLDSNSNPKNLPSGVITWNVTGVTGIFNSTSCTLHKFTIGGGGGNSNNATECAVQFTPTSGGSSILGVTFPGDANHTRSSSKLGFVVTVPIVLSITSPTNNTVTGTPTVLVSGSASANNNPPISSVKWKVDDGSANNATGTTSWSFTTGSLADGVHIIKVNATDNVGNISSKKIIITVDTTKPTLDINSPANNTSIITQIVHVSGTATDGTSVSSIKWKVDNGAASTATTTNDTSSWSFNTTLLSVGIHTIFVNATDSVNLITSKHIGITITEPATITGIIYNDTNNNGLQNGGESGIPNARVIAADLANIGTILQTTTNASGVYSFNNLTPSHTFLVQVAPVPTLHLPSTGHHSYNYTTVSSGQNTINFPLFPITGANPATINGTVFEDTNNNGLQDRGEKGLNNSQVFVVDFLTLTQRTVHTDINGRYAANGILPDNVLVQVAPVPAGHIPSSGHHSFAFPPTLGIGSTTTINFPLEPVSPSELMTINVKVFNDTNNNGIQDPGEARLSGVQVFSFVLLTAEQQNKLTNGTGDITFSGITPDVTLVQVINPPELTASNGTLGFKYFNFPEVAQGANLNQSFGLHR